MTQSVFTCEVGVTVTEKEPYAMIVLDIQQLCEWAVETDNSYLMGIARNCSSAPGLVLQYTYNFVAEWLRNKETIPFYHENIHIYFHTYHIFQIMKMIQTFIMNKMWKLSIWIICITQLRMMNIFSCP